MKCNMKERICKNLLGEEYELEDFCFIHDNTKKHNPEILILPFRSFGIGSRLNFKEKEFEEYEEIPETEILAEVEENNSNRGFFKKFFGAGKLEVTREEVEQAVVIYILDNDIPSDQVKPEDILGFILLDH